MGLYDNIKIEMNVSDWIPNFPVSDEELKSLTYQTKSLESLMDNYLIDIAGHFWNTGSDFLGAKREEHKNYSTGTRHELYDGSILTMPYSGEVIFYTGNTSYKWIEFLAVFYNAKLNSLHCLTLEERVANG